MYYTVYIIADHCSLIHSCTKTHTEISKSNSKWNWYNNTTVCCHWQLTPSQLSLGQKALQLYSKPQFPTIPYHQLPRMIQEHTLVQLNLLYQDWVCNLIITKWLWQWDVSMPSKNSFFHRPWRKYGTMETNWWGAFMFRGVAGEPRCTSDPLLPLWKACLFLFL